MSGPLEFRRGIGETGYADGQNVTLEHHSAGGQYDRFRTIAGDLVRRQVAVIFATGGTAAALAAAGRLLRGDPFRGLTPIFDSTIH